MLVGHDALTPGKVHKARTMNEPYPQLSPKSDDIASLKIANRIKTGGV